MSALEFGTVSCAGPTSKTIRDNIPAYAVSLHVVEICLAYTRLPQKDFLFLVTGTRIEDGRVAETRAGSSLCSSLG